MTALIIAHNTYRETIRDRVLLGIVAAGLALMALTQVAKPLAMGEGLRLTVDLGLSSISFLGLLVVLLVGAGLVAKEIERRTIFNLLSRPLPRSVYLVGKWAGLSASLWMVAAALGLALWVVVAIMGHPGYAGALLQAVYLEGLELTLVTAIAVFFSALSTPVLSALYTLGLFLAGQWCDDLRAFASHAPGLLRGMLQLFADLLPNLPLFDVRTLAAAGELASATQVGLATGYTLLYCGCMLALGAAALESRDFR
jgi:ABC-type transport system involved in multi-copper enzyme maturation permease subunit